MRRNPTKAQLEVENLKFKKWNAKHRFKLEPPPQKHVYDGFCRKTKRTTE